MHRVYEEGCRTTVVCIDSFNKGVLNGRFYNPNFEESFEFDCLIHFLQKMEETLDSVGSNDLILPRQPKFTLNPNDANKKIGKLATFSVRILFRQNGSWQGCCTWLEAKREFSFRSALELILILSEQLECKKAV